MKNKMLTFAGGLAVVALLGTQYAEPLLAQVRATLVRDVNDVAAQPLAVMIGRYPDGTTTTTPRSYTVPFGKRLVIDYLNFLTADSTSRAVLLGFNQAGVRTVLPLRISPDHCSTIGPTTTCVGSERVSVVLEPGTIISADPFNETLSETQVTRIYGHFVDVP